MFLRNKTIPCILIIIILFIQLVRIQSVDIKSTKISSTRNSNRANICAYYSATFTQQQREKSKTNVKQFNYMSDQQIQMILFQNKYTSPSIQTIFITLPHVISIMVLFFLVPALFCCCVWPQKYPLCKTWRKPQNQMYSKCQLKWPAYSSLALYLIILVGALIALVDGPNIVKRYNDLGCKNAAIFDDLLYGRLSAKNQNSFFVGLQPFKSQLTKFNNSNLATFFSDSTNSLSTASQVRTKQSLAEATTQSTYTTYYDSLYTNAFYSDVTTPVNVYSAFKSMYLGPTTNQSTILGNIKAKLKIIYDQINYALDDMITAYNGLSTTTQATVRTQITSTTASITTLKQQLQVYLNEVGNTFYKPNFYNQIYILMNMFYGLVFGFALLGLLGSILLTFCTVVRTRLIMYFTCGSLTILGFFGFGFLCFLGFMQPQMSQICAYVDKRIQNGNLTKNVLRNMGYPNFADRIGNCMTDGTGNVINTIDSSFSNSFDQINVIAQGTLRFNQKIPSFNASNFDAPFISSAATILKVKNAEVWDLNDNVSITHVNKVVAKTYTKDVSCNTLNVNNDVWMPSFYLYSCPAGKAKMPVCADLSLLTTCPAGCYQILNQFVSPSGDHSYIANLATRYSSNTCNYYLYITRLHDNWNVVRQNKMDSLSLSMTGLKTTVDDYSAKANSVKAGLNSFKTTLETNLDSLTNLTSGSFNGMGCSAIGQSIVDYRDSYCIGLLQSVTFNIICLCLICYGILLLACMVTCAGMRHFKHLQKMQMHVGYKGTPISLSDTRLIDK